MKSMTSVCSRICVQCRGGGGGGGGGGGEYGWRERIKGRLASCIEDGELALRPVDFTDLLSEIA